ncbi:MAG: RNA 2',3'-cyclic phosphodiesterase [bacterium]|nr:RNA 2',3'-cyclic phosphodiesterase [bacterium]
MSIRLFIAAALGERERKALEIIQGRLRRELPAVRWVRPSLIHLTLRFLGNVREADIPRITEIMGLVAVDNRPFTVKLKGVGAFPSVRSPRVIWIGVTEGTGALVRMAEHLAVLLEDMEIHTEERRYTPHLTLGRVRERGGGKVFESILPLYAGESVGAMTVRELCLIRSDLSPDGPAYTTLHRSPLG